MNPMPEETYKSCMAIIDEDRMVVTMAGGDASRGGGNKTVTQFHSVFDVDEQNTTLTCPLNLGPLLKQEEIASLTCGSDG